MGEVESPNGLWHTTTITNIKGKKMKIHYNGFHYNRDEELVLTDDSKRIRLETATGTAYHPYDTSGNPMFQAYFWHIIFAVVLDFVYLFTNQALINHGTERNGSGVSDVTAEESTFHTIQWPVFLAIPAGLFLCYLYWRLFRRLLGEA